MAAALPSTPSLMESVGKVQRMGMDAKEAASSSQKGHTHVCALPWCKRRCSLRVPFPKDPVKRRLVLHTFGRAAEWIDGVIMGEKDIRICSEHVKLRTGKQRGGGFDVDEFAI